MNRTDRLYALVEELRAVAPRPRSANWLAARFEVSARTIERDIGALQQSGVAIWAEAGRTGGYCLDTTMTLPPVNFTPAEAVAMAVALNRMQGTPFWPDAGSGLRKLVAAMQHEDAERAKNMAERIHMLGPAEGETAPVAPPAPHPSLPPAPPPRVVMDALSSGHVLRISYGDRDGVATTRDVEPLGYVGTATHWYLLAWCRLRGSVRAFRTDRILAANETAEIPVPRPLTRDDIDIPYGVVQQLSLR